MKNFTTESIRNVALIGHGGEGKTSLAEAVMFNAKVIDRMGSVDNGTSTMDYDQEEINRKISIGLSVGYAVWKDNKINLLDVPGFFDFEGEMISALQVTDAALVVTSASGSLAVGTERAFDMAAEKNLPTMLFVNGVNKENTNFEATIEAIREKYKKVVVLEYPIMDGTKMTGAVSVLDNKAYDLTGKEIPVPASFADLIETAKMEMTELAAETDDKLLEKFFETMELSDEEIAAGIQTAVLQGKATLALGGSATANFGVDRLMDAILRFLPSPDKCPVRKAEAKGAEIEVKADSNAVFVAQAFKTMVDPFFGKLNIVKVMSGTLQAGILVENTSKDGANEKISNIYFLRGKNQESTSTVYAGDICALAKLSSVSTGDILCADGLDINMSPIVVSEAVVSMAVYAKKQGDEDKIFAGLSKLHDEDTSFTVTKSQDTNEMLLSGAGEPHLEIINKKLKNKFGCEAELREPKIAYRETIRGTAEAEGKHKKQSGGAGQFGDVWVKFEPGAEDGEFEFVDAVVGGSVPRQFIPAVEKGLREAIKEGVLAGYPMINLKCTLFDGKYHPVDSKEIAFVTAAKLAYAEGCAKAGPYFLEPMMDATIVVPDQFQGAIIGDMSSKRRGNIKNSSTENGKTTIYAYVPKATMTKYATDLRSMTQGRGKFTIAFKDYAEVPAFEAQKIIEDAKKNAK